MPGMLVVDFDVAAGEKYGLCKMQFGGFVDGPD
jgi:hypothetical protein